jgi:hypothetical protein
MQTTSITTEDIGTLLVIENPESHCKEGHVHQDSSFDDWQGSLVWSSNDTGYNEGAAVVFRLALQYGLNIPALPADLAGQAVGNIWKRREMMAFAKDIAKAGNIVPATAVATASQWHNCHAFKALLRHTPEVAGWLLR